MFRSREEKKAREAGIDPDRRRILLDVRAHDRIEIAIGDEAPSNAPLVVFAGSSDPSSQATFLGAQGVTIEGVDVDPSFNAFILKVGQTATLTDASGGSHRMTLKSIKVVKTSAP